MLSSIRRFAVVGVVALLVAGVMTTTAHAQRRVVPVGPPAFRVYPSVQVQQYAANVALLGRAYSQVPPYALGYNPYPQYYGPAYPYTAAYPTYTPYAYPSLYANPYALYPYNYPNPYAAYGLSTYYP